ncbi:MAG: SAM-dependent DNA methyltransferase, partial [Chloroflexi bacterium]|nr:SAM-dependent DNA methyltransferase [Chloroflexota bacterium]
MPRQTEPSVNNVLGSVLTGMLARTDVRSENTRTITGHPGLRPDILITANDRAPVVIEAEYLPAVNAEAEAQSRLGLEVAASGRRIEAAIALRYPDAIGDADDLRSALRQARLSYCVFTEESNGVTRFPASGWLEGSPEDLADLARLVSVPQRAVDEATTILQEGIGAAAKILDEMDTNRQAVTLTIARLLGMSNVPQTRRMACAIIANALVFHERIAGMYDGVKPLGIVCGDTVANPQSAVLAAWQDILDINYWAIFAVAKDILEQLPAAEAAQILWRLRATAQSVSALGVANSHDLTGRIFQRLIADRKYLATFYTLPASAALLARLAVAKLHGVDWADAAAIGTLRVADFACGTGALLSAVYEQVAAKHERAGGDPAALHQVMMEDVLYGCDVMPSAIHITGSTLSGVEPAVGFGSSRLYTMPYGRQPDGTVKIGSLELLQRSDVQTLFNTSDPALRTGSIGEETAAQVTVDMPDERFDLVIMNPPFTRPGSDWEGSERAEDSIKHFKGLSTGYVTQKEMAKSLSKYTKGTCYHGYAGIASAFAALAHKKIKPGGILALVLPLSAASGQSWQEFRGLIADEYTELDVLTLAAVDNDGLSFSADTGMAECLVIARKIKPDESPIDRALFSSLRHRPQGSANANSLAREVISTKQVRGIEDGPYGGAPLTVGEEIIGESMTAPYGGYNWGAVRLLDCSLAQTAYALSQSRLWLPGQGFSTELRIAALSDVGRRGWYHINIAGSSGPFTKGPPSPTATYPSLWNHNAKNETRITCSPDLQLLVKQGMEEKAASVWSTA